MKGKELRDRIVQLFNQYSYFWAVGVIGLLLAAGLLNWRGGDRLVRLGIFVGYLIVMMVIYSRFQYPDNEAESLTEVEAELRDGQPTLVVLYSQYCLACMAALPAVRDLEKDLQPDGVDTLIVDIHSEGGSDVAEYFDFKTSPTFILCDTAGNEIWRAHSTPSRDEVKALLTTS